MKDAQVKYLIEVMYVRTDSKKIYFLWDILVKSILAGCNTYSS